MKCAFSAGVSDIDVQCADQKQEDYDSGVYEEREAGRHKSVEGGKRESGREEKRVG